jgi:hypothetical protein
VAPWELEQDGRAEWVYRGLEFLRVEGSVKVRRS